MPCDAKITHFNNLYVSQKYVGSGQYTWHMLLVSEQTAIYAIQASQHLLQFQLNTYTEDVQ